MTPSEPSDPPQLSRLLDLRLAADPASPFITFYDDATGERIELSATTLANWVSKTSGLLVDGFGITPSERVGVWLPVHWQSAAILLACWRVGAEVALAEEAVGLAFAYAPMLDHARDVADDVVGLALAPMAGRLTDTPVGVVDYAVEIPGHPDRWTATHPASDFPALATEDGSLTASDLAARAGSFVHAGERILVTRSQWDETSVVEALLGPLMTGGSVVLVRNPSPDADAVARRVEAEGVTAVL